MAALWGGHFVAKNLAVALMTGPPSFAMLYERVVEFPLHTLSECRADPCSLLTIVKEN